MDSSRSIINFGVLFLRNYLGAEWEQDGSWVFVLFSPTPSHSFRPGTSWTRQGAEVVQAKVGGEQGPWECTPFTELCVGRAQDNAPKYGFSFSLSILIFSPCHFPLTFMLLWMQKFYWIKSNVPFHVFLLSFSLLSLSFILFFPTYLTLIENQLGYRTILDTGDIEAIRQGLCSQDLHFRGGCSPPIFQDHPREKTFRCIHHSFIP